jgi:hypothetical protein
LEKDDGQCLIRLCHGDPPKHEEDVVPQGRIQLDGLLVMGLGALMVPPPEGLIPQVLVGLEAVPRTLWKEHA